MGVLSDTRQWTEPSLDKRFQDENNNLPLQYLQIAYLKEILPINMNPYMDKSINLAEIKHSNVRLSFKNCKLAQYF